MDVSRKNNTLIFDHLMLRNFLKVFRQSFKSWFLYTLDFVCTSPVSCILVHPVEYHAM